MSDTNKVILKYGIPPMIFGPNTETFDSVKEAIEWFVDNVAGGYDVCKMNAGIGDAETGEELAVWDREERVWRESE